MQTSAAICWAVRCNLDKLNMCISYDPAISPLGICLGLALGHLDGWSSQICGWEGCGGNLGAHDWDRGQVKCAWGSHRVLCRSQDQKLDVYTQQHRRSVKEPLTKKVENRMKATESPQWIKNSCTQSNNTYFKRTYSNKKTPTQTVACERGWCKCNMGVEGLKQL